jgi:hypothetical protein
MEEILKASWSLFQHDSAAAFTLSERSPLPLALSAKDDHAGQTQISNVRRIWRINTPHPVESDEDGAPEGISDTDDWLNRNGDVDNANDSEDDWVGDVESDIKQDNSIEDLQCPVQRDMSAAPNGLGLMRPRPRSKRQAEKLLVTVNAIETRRNQVVKKLYYRMR